MYDYNRVDDIYDDEMDECFPTSDILTPQEVRMILAIGRNTFYRLVRSGDLPAFRIGKLWRIRREDLMRYAKNEDLR